MRHATSAAVAVWVMVGATLATGCKGNDGAVGREAATRAAAHVVEGRGMIERLVTGLGPALTEAGAVLGPAMAAPVDAARVRNRLLDLNDDRNPAGRALSMYPTYFIAAIGPDGVAVAGNSAVAQDWTRGRTSARHSPAWPRRSRARRVSARRSCLRSRGSRCGRTRCRWFVAGGGQRARGGSAVGCVQLRAAGEGRPRGAQRADRVGAGAAPRGPVARHAGAAVGPGQRRARPSSCPTSSSGSSRATPRHGSARATGASPTASRRTTAACGGASQAGRCPRSARASGLSCTRAPLRE